MITKSNINMSINKLTILIWYFVFITFINYLRSPEILSSTSNSFKTSIYNFSSKNWNKNLFVAYLHNFFQFVYQFFSSVLAL